jgi:hypothetical protein
MNATRSERIPGPPNPPEEPTRIGNCTVCGLAVVEGGHRCHFPSGVSGADVARLVDALRLAWSCLLEVRRDFDAPINNVIAEVEAALGIERKANPS